MRISTTNDSESKTVTKVIKPGKIKFFAHCMAGMGSYKKDVYHEVRAMEHGKK